MRCTVERSLLLKSLTGLTRVVEKRPTTPILGNVLLDAQGDPALRVTGTDLDLTVGDEFPADVETSGAATVPAHLLRDIASKAPSGSQIALELAEDGKTLTAKSGRSKFKLQVLPAQDFPDIPGKTPTHSFVAPARTLRRLFERTSFAISTEETRWYLNGVFVHATDTVLRGVATDGHRLARTEVPIPDGAAGMPGIIVPRKAVTELLRILDVDGDAWAEVSDAALRVTVGPIELTTKLIDGTFPDYERVVPSRETNNVSIGLASRPLQAAVERVMAIAPEKGGGISVAVEGGVARLTMRAPDAGEAADEVDAEMTGGDTATIGVNASYLRVLLDQLGDRTTVRFADQTSPIRFEDDADETSVYVIMPMRVS